MKHTSRRTKIVATVGPACAKARDLENLLRAGVNVFRINSSHASPEEVRSWTLRIRRAGRRLGLEPGILVDLQGPRVRTGRLPDGRPLRLEEGAGIVIEAGRKSAPAGSIASESGELARMVRRGDPILLDNGLMHLEVLGVTGRRIRCRILTGGELGQNKGINLPKAPVTLPAVTARDRRTIRAAAGLDIDFFALSFVRRAEDIRILKRVLRRFSPASRIIAKIEKPQAVSHIGPILREADGIMVARGDLGIEMGLEKIPPVQKELIELANRSGIPVITATQMLESMMTQKQPLRAEVSDIANAVYDGTDAVMLSGETAVGQYPAEAVACMARILVEAEQRQPFRKEPFECSRAVAVSPAYVIAHAAHEAAMELGACAILAFTVSGKTAAYVSKMRPVAPVLALADSVSVSRKLTLYRGLIPAVIRHARNTDEMIRRADRFVLEKGMLQKGDPVIVVSGKHALPGARYMTKIQRIGEA